MTSGKQEEQFAIHSSSDPRTGHLPIYLKSQLSQYCSDGTASPRPSASPHLSAGRVIAASPAAKVMMMMLDDRRSTDSRILHLVGKIEPDAARVGVTRMMPAEVVRVARSLRTEGNSVIRARRPVASGAGSVARETRVAAGDIGVAPSSEVLLETGITLAREVRVSPERVVGTLMTGAGDVGARTGSAGELVGVDAFGPELAIDDPALVMGHLADWNDTHQSRS